MAIKPILHRILVKPDDITDTDPAFAAAGRLNLTIVGKELEREQGAVDTGLVVDFGPTVFKDFGSENPLTIGCRICYAKYGGKAIVDPETKVKYVALNDEDVIAILGA